MSITLLSASRSEVPTLFTLALPIVLGLSAPLMKGLIDTIMIAPLGTTALAAVSLTTSVAIILYSALYGFAAVIGIQIAQAFGAEDTRDISVKMRNGLALSGLVSLAATTFMIACFFLLGPLGQPVEVISLGRSYWMFIAGALLPFTAFFTLKALFESTDRPWLGFWFAYVAVAANVPLNYILIYGAFGLPALGLTGAGVTVALDLQEPG